VRDVRSLGSIDFDGDVGSRAIWSLLRSGLHETPSGQRQVQNHAMGREILRVNGRE